MNVLDLYNQKYYEEHEFSYRSENRTDISRILALLKPQVNDRVLEIGCGLGVLLKKIPSKKKIGIETNDFAIRECRKRGLTVIKSNAEKGLPFKDSSFDIIIMDEVIEHLKNPEAVLKECSRILSPGGKIVLTGPVRSFFLHDISPTHLSEMAVRDMKELVQKCGFKILAHETSGLSFLYPLLENFLFKPFRLLRHILGRKRKKTVGLIDSCHGIADKTLLAPLSHYRKYFLSLGLSQLVLAKKNDII